jgi:predicted aconitase with swiveling domain
MDITLRGHGASKGKAAGEALVCHDPFMFACWEPATGVIYRPDSELHGKSVKDKVVVYPCGCGGVGYFLYSMKKAGGSPKAIVNMKPYHHEIVEAIFAQIPMVYGFDSNLLEIVQTGDHVDVDADEGIITVSKKT